MLSTDNFKPYKKKRPFSVYELVGFVVFGVYTLLLLGPIFWTFLNSLKTRLEYLESVVALPKQWLFSNYIQAFKVLSAGGKNVFVMLINSMWLAVAQPTISILTASMASYVISKYKFPGRHVIWTTMIVMMIVPIYGSGASVYKMYQALHMYDSPLILLASVTGLGGSMMIIAAFDGVSKTYMEAAFIEGAGHFRIFWRIMFPQVTGLLFALWIMAFIGAWNDYMGPIMYLPSFVTLSSGLYIYQVEQARKLNTPVLFAGALMCIVPVVTLFIVFQDKFINLSYGSGIKG